MSFIGTVPKAHCIVTRADMRRYPYAQRYTQAQQLNQLINKATLVLSQSSKHRVLLILIINPIWRFRAKSQPIRCENKSIYMQENK